MFETSWCGYCKKIREVTFKDSKVKGILDNYALCAIDGEKDKELLSKYNVSGFPTIVFVDSKSEEILRLVGFLSPEQFLAQIKQIENYLRLNHIDELINTGKYNEAFSEIVNFASNESMSPSINNRSIKVRDRLLAIYYRTAREMIYQGERKDAIKMLKEIENRYPDSEWCIMAKKLLKNKSYSDIDNTITTIVRFNRIVPVIDGDLTDGAWNKISPLQLSSPKSDCIISLYATRDLGFLYLGLDIQFAENIKSNSIICIYLKDNSDKIYRFNVMGEGLLAENEDISTAENKNFVRNNEIFFLQGWDVKVRNILSGGLSAELLIPREHISRQSDFPDSSRIKILILNKTGREKYFEYNDIQLLFY